MATEELKNINTIHKEFQSLLDQDFKDRKLKENEIIKATVSEITKNLSNDLFRINKTLVFSIHPGSVKSKMNSSGLNVIEYDSVFTEFDLPSNIFKKIKNEINIVNIVKNLFNNKHTPIYNEDESKCDNKILINYVKSLLNT